MLSACMYAWMLALFVVCLLGFSLLRLSSWFTLLLLSWQVIVKQE